MRVLFEESDGEELKSEIKETKEAAKWKELTSTYKAHDYFNEIPDCTEIKVEIYEACEQRNGRPQLTLLGEKSINIEALMTKFGRDLSLSVDIEGHNIDISCSNTHYMMSNGEVNGNVSYIQGTGTYGSGEVGDKYMMAYYR